MEKDIEKIKQENEELKKSNDLKTDIMSIMAHQFRTSLTAMKWVMKMFLDKDLGNLTDEQTDFIKKMDISNERMLKLIEEMLYINKSHEIEIKYNFANTDMVELIDSTLFDFLGESYKKGIEVIFLRPEEKIPLINIDKEKIRAVIQNLVENAVKYSNRGDRVIISVKQKDGTVEFSVKDNGIGIKKEDQDKIFTKFFRSPNAIEKEEVGTGLGLFASKNIVEKHKGKIWFESGNGDGTTFYFTLPLSH